MKELLKKIIFLLIGIIFSSINGWAQSTENVGIGTNSPDNSAILHLDVSAMTTKRGLLIPTMTITQRNSIANPANGLLVYITDDNRFYFNAGTPGTPNWVPFLTGNVSSAFGNITSGTNTSASMLVGTGADLAPTGSGIIQSNKFVTTTSTSDNVDLETSEVNGTLPVTNGGTGSNTLTGMLKGNGTSPVTGVSAKAKQITYWSDDNTISGDDNLVWDSTTKLATITGNLTVSNKIKQEIAEINPRTTAPANPSEGMIYYNGTDKNLKYYDGTQWKDVGGSTSTWNPVVMRAYLNQDTDIINDTVQVPFNAVTFDSHSAFNNFRFTTPVSSYYEITAFLTAKIGGFNSAAFTQIFIYKNGNLIVDGTIGFSHVFSNGYTSNSLANDLVYLNQNDYIEVFVRCTSSTRLVLKGSTKTYLTIHQVK